MSDNSLLPEQSPTEAQPPLDVPAGSAETPPERKVMIALCAICLLIFCGSLIALAFWTHVGLGLISLALIARWLGSSIAEILNETRKTPPPNSVIHPHRVSRPRRGGLLGSRGCESRRKNFFAGAMPTARARFRISIKDHHTGEGLKVELVDAPGLWGERRYAIRLNGKPATKVKVATLSEVFHRLRRWTVARAERDVTGPYGREMGR